MKRKNNLPKYWLGTRKPTSLGYQLAQTGNFNFSSTPGESIRPEVDVMKSQTIPQGLNKLYQSSTPALNIYSMIQRAPTYAAGAGSTLTNAGAMSTSTAMGAAPYGLAGRISGSSLQNALSEFGTSTAKTGLETGVETGATTAGKTALGTAGTVLGAIGTAYGIYDMANQIMDNKSYRSSGQMRDTLTKNTYTTDYGNTYTRYGGVDQQAEMEYARRNQLNKNVNFTASSVGTGLSLGALLAASGAAGSWAGPVGAGVGLLGGLLAYGLGFGDTEDETRKAIRDLTDATSMEGRQSESSARDKDMKAQFLSGEANASKGKRPVFTGNGYSKGKKVNAKGSNGEAIGQIDPKTKQVLSLNRIPGKRTKNTAFADTKDLNVDDNTYIITNKEIPGTNIPLSDYALTTGNVPAALAIQEIINSNMNKNKYACGKGVKKYNLGTLGLYATATLPFALALSDLYGQEKLLRRANMNTPNVQINDFGASDAINKMGALQIDSRPYLRAYDESTNKAAWDIKRNPIYGPGGKMVALDSLYNQKYSSIANLLRGIDEYNMGNKMKAYTNQLQDAWNKSKMDVENKWRSIALGQQQRAALYNGLSKIGSNKYNVLSDAANTVLGMQMAKEAQDQESNRTDIYRSRANVDKIIALTNLFNTLDGNNVTINNPKASTNTKSNAVKASTVIPTINPSVITPDLLRMLYERGIR